MYNTDFEIRKEICGGGNTIYEADSLLASGITDYEILNSISTGNTKYEATINYAKTLGLTDKYATRYEADLAIYNSSLPPLDYYELDENISTDEEFNNLPWGRKVAEVEIKRTMENNTWYMFSFPFTCKRSDIPFTQQQLSLCRVLKVKGGIEDTSMGYDSALIGDDGIIEANQPYQIYNHSGGAITSFIANDTTFTTDKRKTNSVLVNDNWYYTANFLRTTYGVGETKHYAYNDGEMIVWIPSTGKEIKAFSGVFEYRS